jgi:hypothetical protein
MPQSYTGQFLAKSLGMDKAAVMDKGKVAKAAKAASKVATRKRSAA